MRRYGSEEGLRWIKTLDPEIATQVERSFSEIAGRTIKKIAILYGITLILGVAFILGINHWTPVTHQEVLAST